MAIQNWKRIGDKTRTDFIEYSNRKIGEKIAIFDNDDGTWGFEAPGLDKDFKTKPQAMNFARKYMREN